MSWRIRRDLKAVNKVLGKEEGEQEGNVGRVTLIIWFTEVSAKGNEKVSRKDVLEDAKEGVRDGFNDASVIPKGRSLLCCLGNVF